jgi:hypothetical protein
MLTITKSELMAKLGNFRSVKNAPSRNGENQAPNQFIISFENGRVFQSYSSLVAAKIDGQLYLGKDHDYSVTTSRFLKEWTDYNAKERRRGLQNETFISIIDD